jgi:rhomboid protease GluP
MKFFKRNHSNQDESSEEFTSSSEANRRFPNNQTDERENIGFVSPTNTNKTDNSYDIEHIQKKSNKLADEKNQTDEDYSLYIEGEPVYVVKQKRGYLSILFSVAQTIILVGMMIQCGVAPMRINPMVGPYPDALSYWGGKNSYNILYDGEYWRLFSPVMLHAGIFHLLCNVAVQLDTGAFFEREWGMFIWLFIYAGSAGSGSILSVIISPNSIGVGSSGAVCGLFGAKIAEALCRCRESTKTDARELSFSILCEQFASTLCSVILILVFSFIPCKCCANSNAIKICACLGFF